MPRKTPTIELEINTPTVPNFLTVAGQKDPISIAKIPDDQLVLVAENWKKALLARAAKIRQS